MKETTELIGAIFGTLNAIKIAGDKIDLNDLPLLLPLISQWSEAVKDLRFAKEARAATPETIDAAFATAGRQLTAWTANEAAGFIAVLRGLYFGYWLAVNAGYDAGKADALIAVK